MKRKKIKKFYRKMVKSTNKKEIESLEADLVAKKEWKLNGEVKASTRPVNSLLDLDVEFETNVINIPITKDENEKIFKYIVQRYKERTFDNYEFKAPEEKVTEEVYETGPIESNREIFELYDKIEKSLSSMVDYGNNGFES